MSTTDTGRSGEARARRFLESQGLLFRDANVRAKFGELDLVMFDPRERELVFVEVKTRGGGTWGSPEEQVTEKKQRKLRQLVEWYCQRSRWNGNVRLDVVGVAVRANGEPDITHTTHVG